MRATGAPGGAETTHVTQALAPPQPRDSGRSIAATLLALTLGFATVIGWFTLEHSRAVRAEVLAGIWLNILVMLFAIGFEARRRPYSLHLMHLLSLFLFLGAPALYMYSVGRFPLAGSIQGPIRDHLLPSIVAVMTWLVFYFAGYEVTRAFAGRSRGPVIGYLDRPVPALRAMVILMLAVASLAYLGSLGLTGVATRAAARDTFGDSDLMQESLGTGLVWFLIHAMLLRALSVVALLAAFLLVLRNRQSRNPVFLSLVAAVGLGTLVANNPFAASRMWFATSVIAFAAPFFLRRLRTGWGLVVIAVVGLTLLPALNQSRYSETLDELMDYAVLVSPVYYLTESSDVDSLGMLALCHQWTTQFGYRFGLQELGAVLFWFPRYFWRSKPVGTGGLVTQDLGFDFTNLAPPIMAETLVDFGLVGIPFVAMFVGFVLARLDWGYWNPPPGEQRVRVIDVMYPFWLGCIIFITRGGLLSALGFTTAFSAWLLVFSVGASRSAPAAQRQIGLGVAAPDAPAAWPQGADGPRD